MKTANIIVFASVMAALAAPQQFELNLDDLAAKASHAVDVSLNGATLQFAARFLDGKDPDESKVKKLISGLDGIYVKSFEFKKEGMWSQADLDGIRKQLRAPQWSRIVGVTSAEDGETSECYLRNEGKKVTGVAILSASPKNVTLVNIVGPIDLDSLSELGGHLGVPKLKSKEVQK